jgi:hypothetical protein
MPPAEPLPVSVRDELREFVDEYRTRCLWFLRPDLYPETRDQALRMLRYIERYGDEEYVPKMAIIGHHEMRVAYDSSGCRKPSRRDTLSSLRKLATARNKIGFSCSKWASKLCRRFSSWVDFDM